MNEEESIKQLLHLDNQLDAVQRQELKDQLIFYVNHLLLHDFNKLVQILYRVDVSEKKLKGLLQENPQTDAALIIADLLIKRQEEKVKTREAFKSRPPTDNSTGEEEW
jgi:hypothetical protein